MQRRGRRRGPAFFAGAKFIFSSFPALLRRTPCLVPGPVYGFNFLIMKVRWAAADADVVEVFFPEVIVVFYMSKVKDENFLVIIKGNYLNLKWEPPYQTSLIQSTRCSVSERMQFKLILPSNLEHCAKSTSKFKSTNLKLEKCPEATHPNRPANSTIIDADKGL